MMVTRCSYDRPDVVVERLQHVMRIAEDEVFRSFALVVRVTDRVDLVLVVIAHALLQLIISQPECLRRAPRTSTPARRSTV